ncbi:hypothetical protein G6F57_007020 [Rhizopus arrhizus]|uniref:PXA domain-containing protein n=1 Tax=Rhizopus oryzae TaxID=64495 RepID=A0A9P6X5J7_RHIOR|nr:hypothetical protein G6F23_004067 [Rhizopus arrhizus]KAG1418399.1 hypothetical protein G6F58_005091 [Rhizopus delemar]KAG0762776.1 hypothetical protein G6F24_006535 [Rhizopus arrhizus]KAG0786535.1 hypothetical protein G6F21_008526 [Rhizopus arrhizus]KAG0800278.1 hypothetical protein G6F22_002389 [Rhizopus arrhizus]
MNNNNLRPLHLRILFPELLTLPKTDPRRLGPPIDITNSKAVDLELYTYFAFLIRDFIHPWYRLITTDQDLTTEIMKILILVVQKLEKRLRYEVDWTELILIDIPKLLTLHYHDYREAKIRIHMNHGSGSNSVAELFHGMQPHYALEPIEHREFEYLRLMTEAILRILLESKDYESSCVRQLVREILSNLVLFNLIESLADPYTIHMIICKLLAAYEPKLDELEASGKFAQTYFSALTNGKPQSDPFQPKAKKEEEKKDESLTRQMQRLQEKRRLQGQEIVVETDEPEADSFASRRQRFSFGYIILQVFLAPIRSFWTYLVATFTQSQERYQRVNQHKKLTGQMRMIEPIMEFFYAACLVQERPLLQFAWQMLSMFFWPIIRVFGGGLLIDKFLEQTVLHLLSEDHVVFYLRLGIDLLWPNGEFMERSEPTTPLQREQMRVRAERLLTISIPPSVGYILFETKDLNQLQSHIHDILEPIQNKKINKHLLYFLVDLILTKVTRWYWLNYEWKWFNLPLSVQFILKLGVLALFNILLLLFNSNNEDTDLEGRNLYIQGIANRAAQLAIANTAIAVALSAKLSIVQRYFYCIQDTLGWHPWFSRLAFVEALYHGTYQFQYNYHRQDSNVLLTLTTNIRYMTGTGLLLAMITLVIGSHPLIRRISYRLFRWTHLLGLFTFILLGCLHHWAFYVFYAAVLVFWIVDQIDRSFQVDVCVLESMPGNIVKVQAFVPYHVSNPTPGQFAFLSFSSSWFHAWIGSHPFSICRFDYVSKEDVEGHGESQFPLSNESLENQVLTFYIKAFGKRTLSFYQKAVNQERVKLRISRPLGRPQLDLSGSEYGDYKTIVLIADGVGITPWISVLQYVHKKEHTIKTRSVQLIWSIHTIDTYHAFEKELLEFTSSLQQIEVNVHIFITGHTSDLEETLREPIPFTLKYCKPNYPLLLNDIQGDDVAIGVCAHDVTRIHNLALARSWAIHAERFQL